MALITYRVMTSIRVQRSGCVEVDAPCAACRFRSCRSVISRWVMENRHVDREYLDEDLRRLATDLVQFARAARFDTDLRNMRMLRIEPDGTDPNRARATLSSGRLVELMFKNADRHGVVVLGLLTAEMDTQ
jgi:hypothetical protein